MVAGSQAAPAKSKSGTSTDEDSRPLSKLGAPKEGGATSKRNLVLASSDSESTVSLPLVQIMKNQRTKRTKLVKKTPDDQAESNPGPISEIPVEAEEVSTSGAQEQAVKQRVPAVFLLSWRYGKSTGSPTFFPRLTQLITAREPYPHFDRPNPVEEHYLLVFQDIRDKVKPQIHLFDKWCRLRTGYRLNKITSMKLVEEFTKIEDILLSWADTEKVSELLQRRELIWFKMVEQHMRRVVAEHQKEFQKYNPSDNQDIMSISILEAELVKTERSVSLFQARAGLPITFNERTTDRVAYLEITSGLTWKEYKDQLAQLTNPTSDEQPARGEDHQAPEQTTEETTARIEQQAQEQEEHRAQEEERPAQGDEKHAQEEPAQQEEQPDEHQAQAGSSLSSPSHSVLLKERYAEFVSESSELNLLHLPFFRHGKDPLEDFDYNDPRCNPLLRPAGARTPSFNPMHTSPQAMLYVTRALFIGDSATFGHFELCQSVLDVNKAMQISLSIKLVFVACSN
ncbi:hypothetical protein F511_17885 [Dorcoceras hygrometricum]|uniref:Uncharacterized protein n=1 Tax=Dorcoceras hygrometricum TaxID=472368 RepID=A0A2Z7AIA5_9LAMI|nr:hypothetical protein F511_17885 [Dorcoceras hygrometricum]